MSLFKKILIANRGEIAARLIRACHELNIRAVAVYSEADANALHVRMADESVLIGPPAPRESYLDMDRIIQAAKQTDAEAIHPGYGFLSENERFASAVADSGLIFIGPSPNAIHLMGSKTEARTIMQSSGVPIVPGYQGGTDFASAAEKIGYPILVKAAAGGGGKGMRIVRSASELSEAIAAAQREASHAFGDDRVFLEKYIDSPRHIEFQILADSHGNTVHLFERECSIQRRHQKIIEETPSPLLTPEMRAMMGEAAVAAAKAAGYVNAGTVEFIVDSKTRDFYFLEMNTRLQVEHPITEAITGIDLAQAQINIAAGKHLPFKQNDLHQRGHAIECRIYAEDPANDFLPSIGKVLRAVEPTRAGVRVDAGVHTGDEVSIHYDPMIAKVIAYAETRDAAIRKMDAALAEYTLLGLTTNIPFLRAVVTHPAFARGDVTTHFIEDHLRDWKLPKVKDELLIAKAVAEFLGSDHRSITNYQLPANDVWDATDSFRLGAKR
ncbi:MAG: acetyl-CoA carboxylase biotin carboxylase subunit [Chloroflexota bacterium]